ncbi:hypothetical protein PR048_024311 [Dryococelus australis]|uniref:Reverse transcriptase/retrotransposon-derived protein RNase H-like domain-containing protein n=1 Tax=Dryococelus australis TaxID=614101 RepID=A0ABQ9GN95_9NEOP|nr:hypothetical protein PR048_024311 [Dryococelus australis]
MREVEFLEYITSGEGIRPGNDLQQSIKEVAETIMVTQLKAYLGLIYFYARFVPKVEFLEYITSGEGIRPGNDLQQSIKEVAETIMVTQLKAYLGLIYFYARFVPKWIFQTLALVVFDPWKPLIVTSDGSQYGMGAVLSHRMPDGSEQPICFASKTLSKAEQGYFTLHIVHRLLNTIFGGSISRKGMIAAVGFAPFNI